MENMDGLEKNETLSAVGQTTGAEWAEGSGRPSGVTLVAVLNIIGGVIAGIGGVALAVGVGLGYGLMLLLPALFAVVVAVGLLNLRGWARILAIVGYALNSVGGFIMLTNGNLAGLLQLGIAFAVIAYLTRPHVRSAFTGL